MNWNSDGRGHEWNEVGQDGELGLGKNSRERLIMYLSVKVMIWFIVRKTKMPGVEVLFFCVTTKTPQQNTTKNNNTALPYMFECTVYKHTCWNFSP